jgi:putative exporter of polyketide antibiotics
MKKSWLWILLLLILAFALYGVNGTLNKVKDVAGGAIDVVGDAAE